jgi:hypothetical protein
MIQRSDVLGQSGGRRILFVDDKRIRWVFYLSHLLAIWENIHVVVLRALVEHASLHRGGCSALTFRGVIMDYGMYFAHYAAAGSGKQSMWTLKAILPNPHLIGGPSMTAFEASLDVSNAAATAEQIVTVKHAMIKCAPTSHPPPAVMTDISPVLAQGVSDGYGCCVPSDVTLDPHCMFFTF